jgi:hypothetical protein
MPVLGTAIQLVQRSVDVVDDGQYGVGIADAQDPVHDRITEDHPVDIPSRTLNADVVQGGESLTTEEVDSAQIQDKLLRDTCMEFDETGQGLAVCGVHIALDADAYARGCQVVSFEHGTAATLRMVSLRFAKRRRVGSMQPDGLGSGHFELLSSPMTREFRKALQSEDRISGRGLAPQPAGSSTDVDGTTDSIASARLAESGYNPLMCFVISDNSAAY